jgi:hypothetical protein
MVKGFAVCIAVVLAVAFASSGTAQSREVKNLVAGKVQLIKNGDALMMVGQQAGPGTCAVNGYTSADADSGLALTYRKPTCTGSCDGENRACWGPKRKCKPFCNCQGVSGFTTEPATVLTP